MMEAAIEGKIKAMYIMGENPAVSDPKAGDTLKALEKLEFLAVQDLFLTETAQLAHLVLPVALLGRKIRLLHLHRAPGPVVGKGRGAARGAIGLGNNRPIGQKDWALGQDLFP
jgi:hypothetical protein